jgi:hypothetical protein
MILAAGLFGILVFFGALNWLAIIIVPIVLFAFLVINEDR